MNITGKTIMIVLILAMAAFSYSKDVSAANNVTFDNVYGRDWHLVRVAKESVVITIDRTNVQREIYSLVFKEKFVGGRGADNIYRAPYTVGKNNTLVIGRIAGTRTAPRFEKKAFKESEYFRHLERVYRWKLRGQTLELYTYDQRGNAVTLEFALIF